MKDYLHQYLTDCGSRTDKSTSGDELTKLTKPEFANVEGGFVSFVSDPPQEFPDSEEIVWRIQAILPQIPECGSIPFLVARRTVLSGPSHCPSCGDCLNKGDGFICGLCSRAVNLALGIAFKRSSKEVADGIIE